MNASTYGRGQKVITALARKQARIGTGDVVSVQPEGDGRILLVRLERPSPKPVRARVIQRKGKHPVGSTGVKITSQQVKAALTDIFP